METLEMLEDKIESIKWLLASSSFAKTEISVAISAIRKSSGVLNKTYPKGAVAENRLRKEWSNNFLRRRT